MITLKQAQALKPGDILIDTKGKRWKVSGTVKLWKKPENAGRVRVPLKHGLYAHDAITEDDFDVNGNCQLLSKEYDG